MEEIRAVAMFYYRRLSAEEKQLAQNFFSALDVDGDGQVSLLEYRKVLGSKVHKYFDVIDLNGDRTLDFEEVLTLYYMFKVGVRSCDACAAILLGSYFSCLLCEKEEEDSYDLCCACYGGGKFSHRHSVDNLLDDRSMRMLFKRFLQQLHDQPAKPQVQVRQYNSGSSRGTAEKVKTAFEVLDASISVANAVGCIVM